MTTSETPRFQFRISTISLLTAVAALRISLFVLTARHNTQLLEMTQRHNAQLAAQAAQFKLQLPEMELRRFQESVHLRLQEKRPKESGGSQGVEL